MSIYSTDPLNLPNSTDIQTTISPITGLPIIERELFKSNVELDTILANSHAAFLSWRRTNLKERITIVTRAVANLIEITPSLAEEITIQMGR